MISLNLLTANDLITMFHLQFRKSAGMDFNATFFTLMRTIAFEIYHKIGNVLYKIDYFINIDKIVKIFFTKHYLEIKVIF